MSEKQRLVAVTGPTATGKTVLGIALAKRLNGEIVSCDSMQIYQGLKTGTAQPTPEELAQVPHHLVGFLPWEENFSVSDYVHKAGEAIAGICSRGRLPVLVGGTGLYARSLLRGFDFKAEARSGELREKLFREAADLGPEAMHRRLGELDPAAAEAIHPNNVKRVLRALEYCLLSGEPFSQQAARSRQMDPPYNSVMICPVFRDRQKLYDRIDRRVDHMLEDGLLAEAESLYQFCRTLEKPPTAAQSIGYKELFPYFEGQVTFQEAVDSIKRESRRYAKRQLTWFSREPEAKYLYLDGLSLWEAEEACMDILREAHFLGEEDEDG